MPLSRRYKHLKRYQEITNVLLKHGLGHVLDQLRLTEFLSVPGKVFFKREPETKQVSIAERVRLALQELGPAFIKVGQILSTRPDLIPANYIKELAKLQDKVSTFDFEMAKQQIEMELGQPLEELFTWFDPEPLAAASIGQVYQALLPGGEKVIVKVQRPDIEKIINIDLEIMYDIARFLEGRLSWAETYSLVEIVAEFDRTLHEELDYHAEGRNADTFRKNFAGVPDVYIPFVYWQYSTKKVLTLEYVAGVKLTDREELAHYGINPSAVARKVTQAVLKQILIDGFFHGDPHPGNLAALPDGRIIFMDFGMVGFLTEENKIKIGNLVLALTRKSTNAVMRSVLELGVVPRSADKNLLYRDIDVLRRKYYEIPLSQINLGEALNDIMGVAFKHHIRVPSEFSLMVKTLVTLEGVVEALDPDISIIKIAEPFSRKLFMERLSFQALSKTLWKNLREFGGNLSLLHKQISEVLALTTEGQLKINYYFPQADAILTRLNGMINRLAFSIVITGLVIGCAFLARKGVPLYGHYSLADVGFLLAGLTGFWFLISILRSGGL
ncbi:ABC1 kinase family protein [Desulfotomaculum nigrificans]|uniref:ABC1 kinase family protein n=1 Tax=Desulfotomaculum nigrificans TaxID=1565 RepID=UPI0001FAEAF4|nr:AarF/ABC1/UbiB kinase family protein [Desulfotomaculum nigrificans]